jgi:hypothetical protein|nr:MAG TPA: hypothetical protein [Caudoviricetes sp.]
MQFMQSMRGQNPDNILKNMLNSGKINQSQLNQVQQQAKQMESMFSGCKNMFGFGKK